MSNRYKKANRHTKEAGGLPHKLLREFTAIYVFLMLAIYPLYYQNKYFNMGDAKWQFFKYVTFAAGIILIALFAWYVEEILRNGQITKYIEEIKVSYLDWFVLGYMILVLISVIFSPYKDQIIWGYDGWYMGLIAQTCFVLIYFFVSRFWRYDCPAIVVYLAVAFIVFFMAVIMRFGLDPMEMYKDLDEQYIILFLTTIGQATWYSSYMCIIFPLGMFAFWHYDKKAVRILSGIFTSVGFMTMVTQNSDSAFIAFAVIFFVLFWISMESNKRFRRFLEVVIMCLASFKCMGVLQILLPDKAVKLDKIPTFFCQSNLIWILLIVAIIAYIFYVNLEKKEKIQIEKFKIVRIILLFAVISGCIAVVTYVYLNTTGKLPESLRSDNNYLLFDEYWGNNRGSSWIFAGKTFIASDLLRKLFGAGPDGFYGIVYHYFGAELVEKWGENTVLTCAHNEWLNSIINLGLLGGIAYIGIFISAAKRFFVRSKEYPELIAIAIAVLSYMGHNFFCYQQIICTPTIFILIGAGEAIIRYGKCGKNF